MSITQYLQSREGTVVVVDDDFAPPNFEVEAVNNYDRTQLYNKLVDDIDALVALSDHLGLPRESEPGEVTDKAVASASELWQVHRARPPEVSQLVLSCLNTLFETKTSEETAKKAKLNELLEFCKRDLGVTPRTHTSYESAASDIRSSLIVFVDFQLCPADARTAVDIHSQYRDLYQEPFKIQDLELPKLVFLISWNEPLREDLQDFRSRIGLRSAFFSTIRKSEISDEFMRRKFAYYRDSYGTLSMLNRYLVQVESAVRASAEELVGEVRRLELHDLTMLNAFKLAAENESLQSYLTWILSEALAAKFRCNPNIRTNLLPTSISSWPDAKVLPESVLFQLFSEIASSPSVPIAESPPAFGQVYEVNGAISANPVRSLLLVISPACDLIRCKSDYDVLCVRGEITGSYERRVDLFEEKKLFGKDQKAVRHVMKFEGDDLFHYITWRVGSMCTVQANALADKEGYKLVARVSELFCQEVKEAAVSFVSRVGVPVDPAFAVAGSVIIRYRFKRGGRGNDDSVFDALDLGGEFVGALVSFGRIEDDSTQYKVVVFTRQFAEWLKDVFVPDLAAKSAGCPRLQKVEEYLRKWDVGPLHFKQTYGAKVNAGDLVFRLEKTSDDLDDLTDNKMEVLIIIDQ